MERFASVMTILFAQMAWGESAAECQVWRREAKFAETVETHDAKAFAEFLHPGVLFNAGSEAPMRGAEAVLNGWAGIIEGNNVMLRWRPQHVNIGGDPNVAISHGPFVMENPRMEGKERYRVGYFTSIWKRDAKGVWKVLFDGGGQPAVPAESEEAAKKHMAQAPIACPAK